MKIKWNFNKRDFNKAIKGIEKQDASADCLGSLCIGHLCFDLKLMEYEVHEVTLDGDLYIGGVDSGYGYTNTNNLPYDCGNGMSVLTKDNVNDFKTFEEFKRYLENKAIDFIQWSHSRLLVEKMNMEDIFDWS